MVPFNETAKQLFWSILFFFLIVPNFISIPIWIQLIFNSISAVALGALYSITLKSSKDATDQIQRLKCDDKENETMSMSDALKFPFQASFALIALYVLFNNVDNGILLLIFKLNFAMLGTSSLSVFLQDRIPHYLPKLEEGEIINKKYKIFGDEVHLFITKHSLLAYSLAGIINILYLVTDHWTLNNILGITFTIGGIMLLKIANFRVILVLLWILFLYDIFWVFGSDVMVTVATKFDVPIKLKFPNGLGKFSILGLGDMVIPGIILALSLKFDVDLFLAKGKEGTAQLKQSLSNLEMPTFIGALIGYSTGIIMTIISMYAMNHPQPALLFLVPCCSIGILVPIVLKKNVKNFLRYDSEGEKEKEK